MRTLNIRIVQRGQRLWQIFVNNVPIGRPVPEPMVELGMQLIDAGLRPTTSIYQVKTPQGPCRSVSTIGEALRASRQGSDAPFRMPIWAKPPTNGVH